MHRLSARGSLRGRRRQAVGAALAAALVSSVARAVDVEPPGVYEVVIDAALARLPVEFRSVYLPHREALLAHATGQGSGRFAGSPVLARADSHYLMLDAAAESASPSARLRAALDFPRERTKAGKLLSDRGKREGGALPWALAEQCEALVEAIRARNEPEIARLSGVVLHLAVDAGLPFNTTVHRRGPTAAQLTLPENQPEDERRLDADARGRAQDGLILRWRGELAAHLEESGTHCAAVNDVVEASFASMLAASAALDALVEADRELLLRWDIRDGVSYCAVRETFLAELDHDALPIVRVRLDESACFCAGLLVYAASKGMERPNVVAGASPTVPRPEALAGSRPQGRPEPGAKPAATVETKPAVSFIGSKNSTKFHVPGCRWATNIKPDNRVIFSSTAEARAAGREPCSTCDPKD
ncbi:MAG: hypothetical protein BroJett003_03570 [Planctomycetota bacterium]|nr:MAG: hypothetical protein BroJett003_03570 [Planctomycetota bacterium]